MQLVLAAGIALLGGLASGAIEAIVLRQVAIPSAAVAAAYAAAAALLQAVVCVPAGLVAWGACLALARRGGEEERRRRALAASLVTSVLVPIGLLSLRSVHMALLPHTPVLSPQGLAATLAVGLAFLALTVGLTILLGRMLRGGYRQLAVGGYAGAAVSIAMIAFGSSGHGSAPATARAANVLLISIDSLRADVFYEYVEKYASRPLEDFVSGGRLYRNGHTSFSHSLPSHTSMMTGLYPPEHGAQFFYHGLGSPLKEDVETLAERFSAAGFETAAFLNNAWLGPPYGNQAGFGTFVNYGEALQLEPFDPEFAVTMSVVGSSLNWVSLNLRDSQGRIHPTSRLFLRWLENRDPSRPFFAFLHYIEMHPPNDPPKVYRDRFVDGPYAHLGGKRLKELIESGEFSEQEMPAVIAQLRNLHLADMARMEEIIEPVIVELLEGGWLETTLVFLVSDHGENLYEKADTYTKSHVYHTSSNVPFVVRAPGDRGGSDRDDLVSVVDIAATSYAFTGVASPAAVQGRDLIGDAPRSGREWVFVQGWDVRNDDFARAVLFADGYKWIRNGAGVGEWYDLKSDPRESTELSSKQPALAAEYRALFDSIVGAMDEAEVEALSVDELDPDVVDQLKAMGYIEE